MVPLNGQGIGRTFREFVNPVIHVRNNGDKASGNQSQKYLGFGMYFKVQPTGLADGCL